MTDYTKWEGQTDLEQKQKEFWNGWAKRQLQEVTTEEQKKLLSECFVGK